MVKTKTNISSDSRAYPNAAPVAAGAPKAVEVAAPGCAPNNPEPVAAGAIGFAPKRLLGCDVAGAPNPVVVAAGAPKEDAPKAVPGKRFKRYVQLYSLG